MGLCLLVIPSPHMNNYSFNVLCALVCWMPCTQASSDQLPGRGNTPHRYMSVPGMPAYVNPKHNGECVLLATHEAHTVVSCVKRILAWRLYSDCHVVLLVLMVLHAGMNIAYFLPQQSADCGQPVGIWDEGEQQMTAGAKLQFCWLYCITV